MRSLAVLAGLLAMPALAAAETYLILPFSNLSDSQNLDWVGESMAESIRDAMASQGVLALGREEREEAYRRLSIRPYRPMTKASAIRVAESLDADQVVFGSFDLSAPDPGSSKSRGTLRIRAQVIDLRKSRRGPEFEESGPLEDLARLENHLAWQTLKLLFPRNTLSEEEFRQRNPVVRVDAIESYTRALMAGAQDQKLKLFAQAVRLDQTFSTAWFRLGRIQWDRREYRAATASLVRVAANDPHYREAQFYLGLARYMAGDYAGARQSFAYVAEQVPLNEVWNNLGAAQSRLNAPEALASFRKALEGDPTDPDYHFNVGLALYKSGDMQGAAASFRSVLDRRPDDRDAMMMLGRALSGASTGRRPQTALETVERIKQSYEESAYLQLKAVVEGKR